MPISLGPEEILETIDMVEVQNLDIRAVTLGVSLRDCAGSDPGEVAAKVKAKVVAAARRLVDAANDIERRYGIPIINKRVAVTPVALICEAMGQEGLYEVARALDGAAEHAGIDFIGGFTALVEKGMTRGDLNLIEAIPRVLASTSRLCASVNVASTRAGINMDAVALMGHKVLETAALTAHLDGAGAARLVVFCNAPPDNPFMAGAFHGIGEPDLVINVGVSGPGVILAAVRKHPDADLGALANLIKRMAFKITRAGELVGREVARAMGATFGIVDLSLAPTPKVGDSVAEILEAMGLERCGAPGTTAALALLTDAVKKGGAMASSHVGGLSGAFIPVSEDAGMARAAEVGALSIEKLEAMTSVCSVGLDMIAIPGDTPPETIAAIIADEMAIGLVNNKTSAARLVPAPGKKAGDKVNFGGLLGSSCVMAVKDLKSEGFIRRRGRIPAPVISLRN